MKMLQSVRLVDKLSSQTQILQLHHLESRSVNLRVCDIRLSLFRNRQAEIAKLFESKSTDACCILES